MSGVFLGIGAKLAGNAIAERATGILTAIPKPVWEALAVLGYVLALYALHTHYVHTHDAALIASNNTKWQAKLDAISADVAKKGAEIVRISVQLRKANDEENRRIAADAGNLLMRGPGKAACPRVSAAPAAPSGPVAPVTKPDAAGPALPPADGTNVPWSWLVQRAQEHDDLLANDKAWRDWYDNLVKNWPTKTEAAPK